MALLPENANSYPRGLYNAYPTFLVTRQRIHEGTVTLADRVLERLGGGLRVVAIDGFHGVDWGALQSNLQRALLAVGVRGRWLRMADALRSPAELQITAEPFLGGDDRLFGIHFPLGLECLFDARLMHELRVECARVRGRASSDEVLVLFGPGAGLVEVYDEVWYVDIPKDLIQDHARRKQIGNLGDPSVRGFEEFYKRSYFFDWPALNRQKKALLSSCDVFIDGRSVENPAWMTGEDFRAAMHELSGSPFRPRPWFMPGPWGGKFMMGHMGLDGSLPNAAWSYELIVPENGIVLERDGRRLECTFDSVMFLEHRRVLGAAADHFRHEWPIRLDYLDTVDGGNLSTQVHPRPDYIRGNFGETFTQDEAYYITIAKPDARVYLGLSENATRAEFERAVSQSEEEGVPVDIDRFVHSEPSRPHDLFLIPNGTIHCSGKGNLVLEVSATPYIFTFKIYDYLRRDLSGGFRALNIRRAFDNIRFDRTATWVRENLVARPRLLREGPGWKEYILADREESFYNIHRVDFEREFSYECVGRAFAANLVEGDRVSVIAQNGRDTQLAFLESMVIPAATGRFTVRPAGSRSYKLLLVYVRPGVGITDPLNMPIE
jgi:hypothetical protein